MSYSWQQRGAKVGLAKGYRILLVAGGWRTIESNNFDQFRWKESCKATHDKILI
jgi:hypothetical protein